MGRGNWALTTFPARGGSKAISAPELVVIFVVGAVETDEATDIPEGGEDEVTEMGEPPFLPFAVTVDHPGSAARSRTGVGMTGLSSPAGLAAPGEPAAIPFGGFPDAGVAAWFLPLGGGGGRRPSFNSVISLPCSACVCSIFWSEARVAFKGSCSVMSGELCCESKTSARIKGDREGAKRDCGSRGGVEVATHHLPPRAPCVTGVKLLAEGPYTGSVDRAAQERRRERPKTGEALRSRTKDEGARINLFVFQDQEGVLFLAASTP